MSYRMSLSIGKYNDHGLAWAISCFFLLTGQSVWRALGQIWKYDGEVFSCFQTLPRRPNVIRCCFSHAIYDIIRHDITFILYACAAIFSISDRNRRVFYLIADVHILFTWKPKATTTRLSCRDIGYDRLLTDNVR